MKAVVSALDTTSKAVSYMLGLVVLVLALIVLTTTYDPKGIADWVSQVFGVTFVLLMGGLIFTSLFCWVRMMAAADTAVWLEAGLQAASGITTMALTYTLLGISLGIGTLAEQTLNPETVQEVIKSLTANFSLAFMTTVVGLPVSAVLRALLLVTHAKKTGTTA